MLFDSALNISLFEPIKWEKSTCHYLHRIKPQIQNQQGYSPHQFRKDFFVKQELNENLQILFLQIIIQVWRIIGQLQNPKNEQLSLRISESTNVSIYNSETKESQQWRMVRYINGYFKEHIDNQVDPYQIGNDILLPPKNQCCYEGGALVLIQDGKRVKYLPHQTQWTRVFIPLGVRHCVQPVKGTRISFVRKVLGDKEFKYEYPDENEAHQQAYPPKPDPGPGPIGPLD